MDKEELEKEAEEKYSEVDREFIACQDEGEVFNIGYILGAEPREKRIEELEGQVTRAFEVLEGKRKQIADLEKENAELKSNRDYWKESSIYWHKQLENKKYREIAKATQQQLTKAKEIIKQLLDSCFGYNSKTVNYEVKAKAEQFIKDSEVEK